MNTVTMPSVNTTPNTMATMAAVISTHPPLANTVPRATVEYGPSNSVTRGCSSGVLQDLGSCGRECADIDAVSLPANTLVGGCGAWMSIYHGSACHLACTSGYDGNPRLSCDDGTLTVLGSCVENVCSAATVSSDPGSTEFFPGSDCWGNTNGLADGENCTFTCEDYDAVTTAVNTAVHAAVHPALFAQEKR